MHVSTTRPPELLPADLARKIRGGTTKISCDCQTSEATQIVARVRRRPGAIDSYCPRAYVLIVGRLLGRLAGGGYNSGEKVPIQRVA